MAIVGAGPYGLSLAAHLGGRGVRYRIFGRSMAVWRDRMPKGMHLKSEPFASNLYDPGGEYPLSRFYAERGLPYVDIGAPVPLDVFCDYGIAFQQRFVPDLDERLVTLVRQVEDGFEIELDDGATERFSRVVMAVGISHFDHVPDEFAHLPAGTLTHSAHMGDGARFAGRQVAVIGAGASAIDCAVSLADAGAKVHVVTRRDKLAFHDKPRQRSLLERVKAPWSTVGPSWKGVLCTRLPLVFHRMPEKFRHEVTRRFLGPAPCWFTREPFERHVTTHLQTKARSLAVHDGRVRMELDSPAGHETLEVDHVVAATGYRVDLRRLDFLDAALREAVRQVDHTPVLSDRFESSVPGLFFIGVSAANCFGPVLRFACGAGFAARHLSGHLGRTAKRPVHALAS